MRENQPKIICQVKTTEMTKEIDENQENKQIGREQTSGNPDKVVMLLGLNCFPLIKHREYLEKCASFITISSLSETLSVTSPF